MGRGLAYQCARTPGLDCVGIADIDPGRNAEAARFSSREPVSVHTVAEANRAIARGKLPLCGDGEILATADGVDVLIEASSAIAAAARTVLAALAARKHVVLMNSEVDLAFGPALTAEARASGVVCTSCDGDQHTVLKRLIDEITLWGFDLVMAGNLKGFLDRYANPTTIAPEAAKRNLNNTMCTAYTDGTKLSIEMALLANALGLSTCVPGMHGPRADHVREVFDLLDVAALWHRHGPFVDYLLGAEPGGGVFAVGHCDHPYQREMMAYYKMGAGPFYLFVRPYHLCHVEAVRCIAEAALDGEALLEPRAGRRTDVFAYAKRDLLAGEKLDGIGGYACYGQIDNVPLDADHPGLPICLADDVAVARPVRKDEPVLLGDVELDPTRPDAALHRRAVACTDGACV